MKRWITFVFVLLLLLVSTITMITAQDDPNGTDDFTPSAELNAEMDSLEDTTLQLRELERVRPVTRKFPTRQDIVDYLESELEDQELIDFYQEAQQFYIGFDFLPEGSQLLPILSDFLGDQIGGFYDPETNEMNVVLLSGERPGDALPLTERIVFVHEYTHTLQEHHFNLLELILEHDSSALGFNTDQGQAIISLYEGDATAVMTDYLYVVAQENPFGALAEILAQGAASGTLVIPPSIPDIIEAEMTSPYLDGMNFVTALRNEGGWALVDAAYTNPPQSTEHILHPQKYIAGEAPIEVTLEAAEAPLSEDWELILDRTLGEWFLRQYLRTQLEFAAVDLAATGWGGDRYHLYYNPTTDERAWALRLVWDTEGDVEEFTKAYTTFADKRFAQTSDVSCWPGEEDAICLFSEADGGHLITYGPTLEIAEQLLTVYQQVGVPVD